MDFDQATQAVQTGKPAKRSSRAMAGKALAVFLALMALLTVANNALNELAVAQVDTVTPQRGALERRIDTSGELSARETFPVYAEAAVHVERVKVRAGQTVSEGDPLFVLEQAALDDLEKEARLAREAAERSLASAEQELAHAKADMDKKALAKHESQNADVDKAQAAYDAAVVAGDEKSIRQKKTALDDAIRTRDRNNAVRAYFEKQSALEEAERTLAEAREALEKAERVARHGTVRAPFDAQVNGVDLQVGATASTAAASLILSPLDGELELVVTISETEAEYVDIGDEATITVGSDTYHAPVRSVSLSAQEAGRYELAFLLPANAGRAGMSADVELRKRTKNYDLLIPLSALRQDNSGYYVYTAISRESALGAQTTTERADVSVIEKDATRAAVQGGVSQRDTVISRSDRDLSEGDRVRIKEE